MCRNSERTSQPGPKPRRVVPCTAGITTRLAFVVMPFALRLGTKIPSRLFLKDAYRFARSFHCPSSEDAVRRSDSSHGVHRRCPLRRHEHCASTPTDRNQLRRGDATLLTRSVHVVSLDYDGFLRAAPCEFVAPRSQPWGSPSFGMSAPKCVHPSPGAVHPSELFPLQQPPHVTSGGPEGSSLFTMVRSLSLLIRAPTPPACCHVGGLGPGPQPQGFAPLKSPLQASGVATARRPMLPWAL
jgi:hypothetical protein